MDSAVENMTLVPPHGSSNYYYGSANIISFGMAYSRVHGYIASVICVIGIPVNLINAVVLTGAKMRTPCNLILAAMATSDFLIMVIYLPFALHFYCIHGPDSTPERNTLAAARFMLFFACFSIVAHSASIWLTVALGVFRYITVRQCHRENKQQSFKRAKIVVASVYASTFLLCIPNFFSMTISAHPKDTGGIVWVLAFRSRTVLDRLTHHINFWVHAIIMKILPGLILFIFILLLVHTLKAVESSRRRNTSQILSPSELRRIKQTNRPTRLLIIILVLYFITEIPQGIIILLSGVLPKFLEDIYIPLGDFMDILSLSSNNVTFILYCSMSKRFQAAIVEFFCKYCKESNERKTSVKRRSVRASEV